MSAPPRLLQALLFAGGLSLPAVEAMAQPCRAQGITHVRRSHFCPDPHLKFRVTATCIVCDLPTTTSTSGEETSLGECEQYNPSHRCDPFFLISDAFDATLREYFSEAQSVEVGYGGCWNQDRQRASRPCSCRSCGGTGTPGGPLNNYAQNEDPLLISTVDGEYRLTSAAAGVAFDLDADGIAEQTAWTEAGSDDAFLVLDRNGNGTIDDGLEVFGDETPQLPSPEPNGFRALAVFDDPLAGGNGDGKIDAEDPIFPSLQLWIDADHDGIAAPGELSPLFWRVDSIDLDYGSSQLIDQHGNAFRYWTRIEKAAGSTGSAIAFNVFLVQ